MFILKLGNFS